MAGRTEDREGGHVRAEQRQQEHGGTDRSPGEEVALRIAAGDTCSAPGRAAAEDADAKHDREISKDDRGLNHFVSCASSRCDGQCVRTSSHMNSDTPTV